MDSLEHYEERLRAAGQMVTVQRRSMLRYLLRHQTHPTAAEISAAIAGRSRSASQATIYNNLALFASLGILQSVRSPGGETHWDLRTDQHHHLTCTSCGRVDDVDGGAVSVVVHDQALSRRIDRSEVWFIGTCTGCHQQP